jgi:hypothetical protein
VWIGSGATYDFFNDNGQSLPMSFPILFSCAVAVYVEVQVSGFKRRQFQIHFPEVEVSSWVSSTTLSNLGFLRKKTKELTRITKSTP